jgi:transposase
MEIQKPQRRRRYHAEEFKQSLMAACCERGASVAGIALANGVNANQVRRWMRERGIEAPTRRLPAPVITTELAPVPAFVPIAIAPTATESRDIRIEIRRGNAAIKIDWPVQVSGDCAAWLRDWLK